MSKFINKYTTETARSFVKECGCELKDEYKGMNEKHKFICSCGNPFITTFAKFQNRRKRQCNYCGRKRRQEADRLNYSEVKERIEKYGCELLSKTYTNYKDKNLTIKCHCGEIFTTSLACYENSKHQCNNCSQRESNESKNKYTVDYIKNLCANNGSKLLEYDSESIYIGTKDKITLSCSKCGKHFTTSLGYILSTKKYICNDCAYESTPSSTGEIIIKNILDKNNNVVYKEQYSFDDCVDKYKLRFDFAVFKNSKIYLIEFDGIQHFKPFEYYGGVNKFNDVVKKDNIKNEYCKSKNIPLLRIKYNDIDIENKINEFLVA